MTINDKKLLVYLSIKHNGDWEKIYESISKKMMDFSESEINQYENKLVSCNFITIMDDIYPASLRSISKPPFVLFYKGNISLLNKNKIGIFCSRKLSDFSKDTIKHIKKEIDICGYGVVVNGMSSGSGRIILGNYNPAIVVLGCGIDRCYPNENNDIYDNLCKNGLVLSEYAGDLEPTQDKMVHRALIMAGLSDQIIIGESHRTSASAIIASQSLMLNKNIFAIPDIENPNDFANDLLCQGAIPLVRPEQIKGEL